ncbi:NAD-dependent epimerase/dehydratase [Alkalidesulfovibrio alkalitolerans DSM 16529]|jgi:UDP-sulfoquinovose synthase|uniref:NAD-dependent epimerase/dehydratase n=1 Tax=Alkalidesulfovibrio alkalitolerans DSM 16529 TaxID=1121439 RepID=S7TEK1_9BACT|nr:NAD-dependent epimerase/dehydratase family protein [Alkalidesulfovibrio alkalitolerans]EPR35622.1 NAD-dependent epimerase/dehydratase [Alkalidesulfovibrio alkalitolerans DSM 16529]
MQVLILGGDGYLGWPTAMYFSARGHAVTVVDNYFRRHAATELDTGMLYDVPNLVQRARIWHERTGREIKVVIGDLRNPETIRGIFTGNIKYAFQVEKSAFIVPDSVMHFAEQPSAPYSLMSHEHANFTLSNNILITNNLMFAVKDFSPETHIVHIGTMGEYGTPNIDIEEGWIDIEHKGRKDRFLFPRQASSIYHTSKIMDTDLLWFGIRTWNLRATDLMQGPVYGIETEETIIDPKLRPFFNYDEIFGTVVNRFITQAVAGYPLTVYGKGGQTRGYLNIRDTLQCVYKAALSPAEPGELRVFNQIMETFTVVELAEKTARVGRNLGLDVTVQYLENPRKEAEEHYYNPTYHRLLEMGVEPHYLTDEAMEGIMRIVREHGDAIRKDVIFRGVKW